MPDLATIDLEEHVKDAMTHHRHGRLALAQEKYDHILAMQPHHPQVTHLIGVIALQNQDYDTAIEKISEAIALEPQEASYHLNLGVAYKGIKHNARACACFEQALRYAPDWADAHFNLAVVLHAQQRLEEAIHHYEQAIALDPHNATYRSNLGASLQASNRLDEALVSYDHALALHPHHPTTLWNKSLTLLLQGQYAQGWPLFEARWQRDNFTSAKRALDAPLWLGQTSLANQRILLHGEQGLGDFLQFCRYVSAVAALGAHVILETPACLLTLLSQLEGVGELVTAGQPLPSFDYHCPLMSLPLALNTQAHTIPPVPRGLVTRPVQSPRWQALRQHKTTPTIGFVWHGNAAQKNDHNRSMPLALMLEAFPPSLTYVSLQKECTAQEKELLRAHTHVHDMSDEIHDFADTAALCQEVDLVISVCTSVAHLSASLQRPTWILLAHHPDWRWELARSDSPWYPSAKLYRQTQRQDWSTVTRLIHQDLLKLQPSFTRI